VSELELRSFCLGQWMTNCYVLFKRGSTSCWIIDASFEPQAMIDAIRRMGLTPVKIILTHAHLDHIAGLQQVHDQWPDAPIYIHARERDFLTDTTLNLSAMAGIPVVAPEATDTLSHGQVIDLDGLNFEVRHTPGHSPGGLSLIHHESQTAIVGDTLFAGSIGRYDFPTSNAGDLFRSITEQLMSLPDGYSVHPGHGPSTTIGDERRQNPYLRS